MNGLKYIGMDVHLASISRVVLDAAGKLVMEVTIKTEGAARGERGSLRSASKPPASGGEEE